MKTQSINSYWAATAKCGHVGNRRYVPKELAVRAQSAKEAALIARNTPRVKHHNKFAVLSVELISLEEYRALKQKNRQDPYFHCHSVQDQRELLPDVEEQVVDERYKNDKLYDSAESYNTRQMFDGKVKIRNPRHYIKYYPDAERLSCVY